MTKKSGKKAKKDASETSTAVVTIYVAKKNAPIHMVGPGVTSLPMQDHILANLRVKDTDTQQPRVSPSTSAGRVFEVDLEEEELDYDGNLRKASAFLLFLLMFSLFIFLIYDVWLTKRSAREIWQHSNLEFTFSLLYFATFIESFRNSISSTENIRWGVFSSQNMLVVSEYKGYNYWSLYLPLIICVHRYFTLEKAQSYRNVFFCHIALSKELGQKAVHYG